MTKQVVFFVLPLALLAHASFAVAQERDRDWRGIGPATAAQVLAYDEYDGKRGRYARDFALPTEGVLIVSASGTGAYRGPSATASVSVDISVNDASCARDMVIATNAQVVTLHANAVCVRWLQRGEYRVLATKFDDYADEASRLTVSFVVIAASSGGR